MRPDPHLMTPKDLIARRVAQEIRPGTLVNLGIGIPTRVSDHLPEGMGLRPDQAAVHPDRGPWRGADSISLRGLVQDRHQVPLQPNELQVRAVQARRLGGLPS